MPGWKMDGIPESLIDSKTGRQKSAFGSTPNFTWPDGYSKNKIYVLGPYDMKPWFERGYWAAAYASVKDGMANKNHMQWIWWSENGNIDSDARTLGIYKIYNNTSDSTISATMYFICDDFVEYVGVNNQTVLSTTVQNSGNVTFDLLPGENFLQFNCKNNGGPGGFVGICYDPALNVLFGTDGSWGWMLNTAAGDTPPRGRSGPPNPPPIPPTPPPKPTPAPMVTLGQHCGKGEGWQKTLPGPGTYTAGKDFPPDSSFIEVPANLTATLSIANGTTQVVAGPSDFNFCSKPGFNDGVKQIVINSGGPPPPPPPPPAQQTPATRTGCSILQHNGSTVCRWSNGRLSWMDSSGRRMEDVTDSWAGKPWGPKNELSPYKP
jgi:hypothetical protein